MCFHQKFCNDALKSKYCFNVSNKMLFKEQFSKYQRIRLKVSEEYAENMGFYLK